MLTTDTLIWLILAGTATVCVVSMLGVFSSVMQHETTLHDLRNRVAELQYGYTLQVARLHGHLEPEDGEVDVLGDDGQAVETGVEVGDDAMAAAA